MDPRIQFQHDVNTILNTIDPQKLSYNESEFWIIQSPYEFIEFYALNHQLKNTAIALPLARGLHNGVYRKSTLVKDGIVYHIPYVFHCLHVCRILIDMQAPLSRDEEDIMLASALCHDMIEDIPFENHGTELMTEFHLDPRVFQTVQLVSKRHDFTPEEEAAHFRAIEENKLSLLVKLTDRSHNVEDLYNMKYRKVHEYVDETNKYFDEMCRYGLIHYPELAHTIEIMFDKIFSMTTTSETIVARCEARENELKAKLSSLKEENARLRALYRSLLEG